MIPTIDQIKTLWDKYNLPPEKRKHVVAVAEVAEFIAQKFEALRLEDSLRAVSSQQINIQLLLAGALLHDIDKNAEKLPGEKHPDASVRILQEEGMSEVAALVKTHPLHAIIDPSISPKTWEEKILFLADKMCKYEIITVDQRFDLWRAETDMPQEGKEVIKAAYPLVKALEKNFFSLINTQPTQVATLVAKSGILETLN